MRILASNPDTIGDLVLREPLYRALREVGHDLVLIVRPSVLPLVPYVAPGAATLVLPTEVYRDDLATHWGLFDDLFRAAREFRPDVLLVAPYQWTAFEEKLAAELAHLPGLRRVGMSGRRYAGDPHAGHMPPSRMMFDVTAEVDEASAEVEKNAALAEAVVGRRPEPVGPRIVPGAVAIDAARAVLAERGLEPGGYWVACVTGTVNVPIKAWPAENWGHVLGEWSRRHGRRFLFIGLPDERPVADEVRRLMGAVGEQSAVRMEPGGTLDEVIALAALSGGYVGHDTGPMHVAAAVGKPVLGVFGGGHWPRFVPRVVPSVSLTVGVPCAGCGWACSFDTSHCVKALPADEVLRAVEDLEAGRVTGQYVRSLAPTKELLNTMVGEVARFAQKQLRDASDLSRRVRELAPEQQDKLRAERDGNARRAAQLAEDQAARQAAVEALARELRRVGDEAADITAQLHEREAAVAQLREQVDAAHSAVEQAKQEAAVAASKATAEGEALREQVRQLESRVRVARPPRKVRRPWREVAVDVVCGQREYVPRRPPRHMPAITYVVLLVGAGAGAADDDAARATIESVVAQRYPHLDFVLARGCDGEPPAVANEFKDSIDRVVCDPAGSFAAVAKAFDSSTADVLGWLDAGDMLEPGALLRAGETFRDHPRTTAVYLEDTTVANGWRVPMPPRAKLDVPALLGADAPPRVTAFFRRREYKLLGPIDPAKRSAAGWDLLVRFARRYGLRRGAGGGACRGPGRGGEGETRRGGDEQALGELAAAREAFLATLGRPGRARLAVLHWVNRAVERLRPIWDRRLSFGTVVTNGRPLPPVESRARDVADVRAGAATGRPPDRLLFSGLDTTSGDRRVHQVYYDSVGDVAVVHPAVGLDELKALYAARGAATTRGITLPHERFASPYVGYRGGWPWERLLLKLPSPYWRIRKPEAGDATADRVLSVLVRFVRRDDQSVRFLNVGCYEGLLLDRLRAFTKWRTAGTETNPFAVRVAAGKGHAVWETSAQDAAMTIPVGESFDVIFLSGVIEHLDDPLAVLRRLRQLLTPGGWLVLNQPNLDSKLLDLFGPTWAHWQLPYHRTLTGRRGLRRMAAMADLRVVRMRTYTDPYPATVSAGLNALGLGAVVPEGAKFPDDVSSRGARAAGWARMLWDWRGRGDYLYAVMRAM